MELKIKIDGACIHYRRPDKAVDIWFPNDFKNTKHPYHEPTIKATDGVIISSSARSLPFSIRHKTLHLVHGRNGARVETQEIAYPGSRMVRMSTVLPGRSFADPSLANVPEGRLPSCLSCLVRLTGRATAYVDTITPPDKKYKPYGNSLWTFHLPSGGTHQQKMASNCTYTFSNLEPPAGIVIRQDGQPDEWIQSAPGSTELFVLIEMAEVGVGKSQVDDKEGDIAKLVEFPILQRCYVPFEPPVIPLADKIPDAPAPAAPLTGEPLCPHGEEP